MYFWKIKALKIDIKKGLLTSKDNFNYFLAYTILYSLFLILAVIQLYESFGVIMALVQVLLFISGIYYAYYSNGGVNGRDFTKHFFSIGWVFLIRASFFMTIGMINLYVMTWLFDIEKFFTIQNSAIIALVFEVVFYWRIGKHISDLRTKDT